MNLLKDNFCLIFACREVKESDQEIDFVIDGERYVIEAASKANLIDLEKNMRICRTNYPIIRSL